VPSVRLRPLYHLQPPYPVSPVTLTTVMGQTHRDFRWKHKATQCTADTCGMVSSTNLDRCPADGASAKPRADGITVDTKQTNAALKVLDRYASPIGAKHCRSQAKPPKCMPRAWYTTLMGHTHLFITQLTKQQGRIDPVSSPSTQALGANPDVVTEETRPFRIQATSRDAAAATSGAAAVLDAIKPAAYARHSYHLLKLKTLPPSLWRRLGDSWSQLCRSSLTW
jgi:hypothetical protein